MKYFKQMKDFYVELEWKIEIPVLSFLCPKDRIKIWKKGTQIRIDTTFVNFQKLSVIRENNSHYIKQLPNSDIFEIFKCSRDKQIKYNYYEPLDNEEKEVIVKEILNRKRVKGNFKILKCELKECLSFFDDKKVFEKINGKNAQKFEVNLEVQIELHPDEILIYNQLYCDNYLNKDINIIKGKKKVKENKSKYIEKINEYDSDIKVHSTKKVLKAYCWAIPNGPIHSGDFLAMINSISSMNDVTEKMREFFGQPQLQELIQQNYFPIKIKIPYNIFVDFTVNFDNFIQFDQDETNFYKDIFEPLESYKIVKRKDEENLVKSDKKRGKYINLR